MPKYGFGRLNVGEQLMLPLEYRDQTKWKRAVVRVRNAANSFGERTDRRFSVTTVENGAQVRRIA